MNDDKFQFLELTDLQQAADRLKPAVRHTPLLESQTLSGLFLKCENLQWTGSFKIRTALNQLFGLERAKDRGVVTSSSGNFAQGVARAASILGIDASVVMMKKSNPLKIQRTRELGARVIFCENRFEARNEEVARIAESEGRVIVHPFDRLAAIGGNASIGLEILQDYPETKCIVAPVSGGGLISGIALAAKLSRPETQVIGVQPSGSNATALSFKQGYRVSIQEATTMADGLMVTTPGEITFQVIQQFVDDIITVSEETIREATRIFLERERLVVEPSGAVPLAAILEKKVPVKGSVLVISGGNIAPELIAELVSRA